MATTINFTYARHCDSLDDVIVSECVLPVVVMVVMVVVVGTMVMAAVVVCLWVMVMLQMVKPFQPMSRLIDCRLAQQCCAL